LQPGKGIVPPDAVIVVPGHRLAELAIVRNVDAELLLHLDDGPDRTRKTLRISGRLDRFALSARAVDGDEILRPRQAAGMCRDDAIRAALHDDPPLATRTSLGGAAWIALYYGLRFWGTSDVSRM